MDAAFSNYTFRLGRKHIGERNLALLSRRTREKRCVLSVMLASWFWINAAFILYCLISLIFMVQS